MWTFSSDKTVTGVIRLFLAPDTLLITNNLTVVDMISLKGNFLLYDMLYHTLEPAFLHHEPIHLAVD